MNRLKIETIYSKSPASLYQRGGFYDIVDATVKPEKGIWTQIKSDKRG
jgi:hypothetical protein